MYFNKKIAAIAAGIIVPLGIGIATTATASTTRPVVNSQMGTAPDYCVEFGPGAGATGNFVLRNWDDSATCPKGTYPHSLIVHDSDPFLPPGFTLDSSSINPTRAESGFAFTVTDFATTPATFYDCMYTVPKLVTGTTDYVPGVVCTKAS